MELVKFGQMFEYIGFALSVSFHHCSIFIHQPLIVCNL